MIKMVGQWDWREKYTQQITLAEVPRATLKAKIKLHWLMSRKLYEEPDQVMPEGRKSEE